MSHLTRYALDGEQGALHEFVTMRALSPVLLACFLGCGGAEAGQSSPSDSGDAVSDALDINEDAADDPLVGIWIGDLSGYVFPSGSTKVVATFAKSTDGSYTTGIQFGSATTPGPPSDPNVGYPAGVAPTSPPEKHFYAEGFDFTATGITVSGSALAFELNLFDFWSTWCSIEPAIDWSPDLPGQFGCIPHWKWSGNPDGTCTETNPSTGEAVPVDCGKLTLCLVDPVCICKSSGCVVAASVAQVKVTVDFSHKTMLFSIAGGPVTGSATLTKQPG